MSESFNRLRRFVEIRSANYRSRPGIIETVYEYVGPDSVGHDLTEHDLEQVVAEHAVLLAEVEQLRETARVVNEGAAFYQRKYDEVKARADAAEILVRRYEARALLNGNAAPQQPERDASRYSPIIGHDGIHRPTKPARDGEAEW